LPPFFNLQANLRWCLSAGLHNDSVSHPGIGVVIIDGSRTLDQTHGLSIPRQPSRNFRLYKSDLKLCSVYGLLQANECKPIHEELNARREVDVIFTPFVTLFQPDNGLSSTSTSLIDCRIEFRRSPSTFVRINRGH
jgi:hypothetical protein